MENPNKRRSNTVHLRNFTFTAMSLNTYSASKVS